jgi:glycosyltransferase involved in cell wall biosynthesis
MNILLINHYAGSPYHGMEFRTYYMAREWVRAGHQVTIVASATSHIRARAPELGGKDRLEEIIDGIRYLWFATPAYTGNGAKRVLNMASFVRRLYREGEALAARFRPDVVIGSSTYPMDMWPARRIANLSGARLVFEVHDLWPLSPMELGGMSARHPFIMMVQAAEDYAYRKADAVVSMLPKVRKYMESRGMAPHKLHIVPNGIDPSEWNADGPELATPVAELFDQFKGEGKAVVGYAGTHGVANAMEVFIDAARLMQDQPVAFVLVGGGPDKPALQARAQAHGLRNVHFLDPVQKAQIPALLRRFDIAYIGAHRQPLYRFGISPNKLMDYMMAGRLILSSIDAGNDPVAEAGCGLTVRPEDPEAVVDGLRELLALDEATRQAMGERGRAFVQENHTYPVLAKRFLAAIGQGAPSSGFTHTEVEQYD